MFNLNQHKIQDEKALLKNELIAFDISLDSPGKYVIKIGDEELEMNSLSQCKKRIQEAIKELRSSIWEQWHQLANVAELILNNDFKNEGSIQNLIFLSMLKKIYFLSTLFPELDEISSLLYKLFNVDLSRISDRLISRFNFLSLYIRLIHRLIISELYRIRIIDRYQFLGKEAQVSGPWANLDLPMSERIWHWDGMENEYFRVRDKQIKEQLRYNPETLTATPSSGFYYVWQDLTRGPYDFFDIRDESPYKHRLSLMIP